VANRIMNIKFLIHYSSYKPIEDLKVSIPRSMAPFFPTSFLVAYQSDNSSCLSADFSS
jgi:hypothetical protein